MSWLYTTNLVLCFGSLLMTYSTIAIRLERNAVDCPAKCECTQIKNAADDILDGLKVKCGGSTTNVLYSLKELDFSAIELEVVYL
jgi:hypothetical protein